MQPDHATRPSGPTVQPYYRIQQSSSAHPTVIRTKPLEIPLRLSLPITTSKSTSVQSQLSFNSPCLDCQYHSSSPAPAPAPAPVTHFRVSSYCSFLPSDSNSTSTSILSPILYSPSSVPVACRIPCALRPARRPLPSASPCFRHCTQHCDLFQPPL